jgi:unsaturated chondroitin disaccharide hydrolase
MSAKIIATLKSEEYRTKLGENITFLLKHSVGNFPTNTEIDVPIVYADYYFVEAIMRYRKLFN